MSPICILRFSIVNLVTQLITKCCLIVLTEKDHGGLVSLRDLYSQGAREHMWSLLWALNKHEVYAVLCCTLAASLPFWSLLAIHRRDFNHLILEDYSSRHRQGMSGVHGSEFVVARASMRDHWLNSLIRHWIRRTPRLTVEPPNQ